MGGQPREFHLKLWLEAGFRGGRADGRLELPQTAIESAADLQKAGVIQPEQLGRQNGESRGQDESQAQDEYHRSQSAIRHGLSAARFRGNLGTMIAGMQKAMLERPIPVRSFQPLFSFFQRACPNDQICWPGKVRASKLVIHIQACCVVSVTV